MEPKQKTLRTSGQVKRTNSFISGVFYLSFSAFLTAGFVLMIWHRPKPRQEVNPGFQ
jgi:hypothetical protein